MPVAERGKPTWQLPENPGQENPERNRDEIDPAVNPMRKDSTHDACHQTRRADGEEAASRAVLTNRLVAIVALDSHGSPSPGECCADEIRRRLFANEGKSLAHCEQRVSTKRFDADFETKAVHCADRLTLLRLLPLATLPKAKP